LDERLHAAGPISRESLHELYSKLLLIRQAEERLSRLFSDGEVPGFIHLSIGQEAVAVGVMSVLTPEDTIASTHRGHGHALAKGLSLKGFFAELLAKDEGLCRGRGGSMHVADLSCGMLGANGIVGAGLSIALGSALAHKTLIRDAIAVAFFGDGALAEGLLHECLNMAVLWQLPMLFVCENNGWSEFQPSSKQLAFSLADLSTTFKTTYIAADGNDVVSVASATRELVDRIRAGGGPAVLECVTVRVRGHFEGDAQKYRDTADLASLPDKDPIRKAAKRLIEAGIPEEALTQAAEDAAAQIEEAVTAARQGSNPSFDAARADVYTPAEAG
jgi:pyruvate dehydrogenase E1 component alpha subunit